MGCDASIESDTWLTGYPRSQDPAPRGVMLWFLGLWCVVCGALVCAALVYWAVVSRAVVCGSVVPRALVVVRGGGGVVVCIAWIRSVHLAWSTARAAACLWDSRNLCSQTEQFILGLR